MIKDLIRLFFPECCYGCGNPMLKSEELICTNCMINLPRTHFHLEKENPVKIKFYGKLAVDRAFSYVYFRKQGIVQPLLHYLKYRNVPELGKKLGLMYGRELTEHNPMIFDMIVPIPLTERKLKLRGYNQSDYFAMGLSEILQIDWLNDVLKRIVEGESQTRKSRLHRWLNVKGSFKVLRPEIIGEKHILLVDDVVTSGSTLESCGKALLDSGAAKISVATIATA